MVFPEKSFQFDSRVPIGTIVQKIKLNIRCILKISTGKNLFTIFYFIIIFLWWYQNYFIEAIM